MRILTLFSASSNCVSALRCACAKAENGRSVRLPAAGRPLRIFNPLALKSQLAERQEARGEGKLPNKRFALDRCKVFLASQDNVCKQSLVAGGARCVFAHENGVRPIAAGRGWRSKASSLKGKRHKRRKASQQAIRAGSLQGLFGILGQCLQTIFGC